MENKHVGIIIVGISIAIIAIVSIFNSALKNIVGETCTHGPTCSMFDTISTQTWLSLSIAGIILIIGLVIMFTKPKEKIITKEKVIVKRVKEKKKKIDTKNLDEKEKQVVELLEKEGGGMFQADLKEKLGIGKVGMTRLLDKLEAKQIIERKRRGMNNIVLLKK